MIKLSNWTIEAIGAPFGRQYDNLTRHLDVCGDIPPSWSWDALLQFGDNLNIITLSAGDDGRTYRCLSDTNFSPEEYPQAWESAEQGEPV